MTSGDGSFGDRQRSTLTSTSRIMDPRYLGEDHYRVATTVTREPDAPVRIPHAPGLDAPTAGLIRALARVASAAGMLALV